jgi:hypothetical protein
MISGLHCFSIVSALSHHRPSIISASSQNQLSIVSASSHNSSFISGSCQHRHAMISVALTQYCLSMLSELCQNNLRIVSESSENCLRISMLPDLVMSKSDEIFSRIPYLLEFLVRMSDNQRFSQRNKLNQQSGFIECKCLTANRWGRNCTLRRPVPSAVQCNGMIDGCKESSALEA